LLTWESHLEEQGYEDNIKTDVTGIGYGYVAKLVQIGPTAVV
jgi:hypothetical protein